MPVNVAQLKSSATPKALAAGLALMIALVAPAAGQAAYKPCEPVLNIFEGSRYEGSKLYNIRAQGVTCATARRVARRGTYKAVADVPDAHGRVKVSYRRWTIFDDLRASVDRFVAKAPNRKRVRWLFGGV
jgi:hypothetical protein